MSHPVPAEFSESDLLAYLDEMLPLERCAAIEQSLRTSPELQRRLSDLLKRRDQGGHTVGEIWRRRQLSCLTRTELGSYLLGVAEETLADYIEFHVRTIGCRVCQSNLDDLREAQQADARAQSRRRRYFESSAGLLRRNQ